MNIIINLLELLISCFFVYAAFKFLLPEIRRGIFEKKCTLWSRDAAPKTVKGLEAIKCAFLYVFLSILSIILLILSFKQFLQLFGN